MNEPSREQQLESILHAYLQDVDAGRTPDRDELLRRHPELADDIRAFLDDQEQMDRFARSLHKAQASDAPAGDAPDGEATIGADGSPAAEPPRIEYFGDYELLAEIARGGMGVVYKARQVSLNRIVAIKMILAGQLASPAEVQRFRAEAEAAANLDHPNIVPIYEIGEHEGRHYFSMKLVEGGNLSALVPAAGGFLKKAIGTLSTVARAVHFAHQRRILHRDLKPANILLDAKGVPMVSDFGLAKRVEGGSDVTRSGAIIGTPSYMAPEQARAEKGLSTAADVYSLGAILFELLTGRPPFKAATPFDTLMQVVEREPDRPSRVRAGIDRDLETICLKCLEKEPAKRYASAEAFAADLDRWLRGEPITARPAGRLEQLAKWARRKPAAAALAAVSGVGLVTLLAGGLYFNIQLQESNSQLVEQVKRAEKGEAAALENARKETAERRRADGEADAAWANQYLADANLMANDWEHGNYERVLKTLDIYRRPPPGRKDPRGWEWHFQDRLCRKELFTLVWNMSPLPGVRVGSTGAVAFSPDGTQLAAGGAWNEPNKTCRGVQVWDLASRKEIHTLPCTDPAGPMSVAFSPNGTRLAAVGDNVFIWDLATGTKHKIVQPFGRAANCVAFSLDGTRVVAYDFDRKIKQWEAATGAEIPTPPDATHLKGREMVPSANGTRRAATDGSSIIKVWDATTGKELREFRHGSGGGLDHLVFSPDGTRLAAVAGKTLVTWDVDSGSVLQTFHTQTDRSPLSCMAFSPDGARLASARVDGIVELWDVVRGGPKLDTFLHSPLVMGLAFSPDGTRLASAGYDGKVKVWSVGWDRSVRPLRGAGAVFSPDGLRLAQGGAWKQLTLRDVATGGVLRSFEHSSVTRAAFSPDGTRLASGGIRGVVKLWDTGSGKEIHTFTGHKLDIDCIAFSPDGTRLATGDFFYVYVWDVADGKEISKSDLSVSGPSPFDSSLAFSLDGRRLARARDTVQIFDAATGEPLESWREASPFGVPFSFNESRREAQDALYGAIRLGHGENVKRMALSRNAAPRFASGSLNGIIKLWEPNTSRELRTFKFERNYSQWITFSPDGNWLVAGDRLLDGRPLTPAVQVELEAVSLLVTLFAKPLPKSAVRAAVQKQIILTDAARKRALESIELFREETDPREYHAAAWPVIRHPYSNVFTLETAVVQMQAACAKAPQEEKYQSALGIAHYRLGTFQKEHYKEALKVLAKCDQDQPATLAFLAMTQHRLGQRAEAQATLGRLKSIVKTPRWANERESQGFLAEAETLIEAGSH
jgi:WD40 repeat protein/tRNA A-37 threonylcarbamoyl transferase component Bud32